MSPPSPNQPPQAPLQLTTALTTDQIASAGFWMRLMAFIIDMIIIIPPCRIIFGVEVALFRFVFGQQLTWAWRLSFYIPTLLLLGAYFALQEASTAQATVGKRLLGLVVTDLHGQRLSLARATGRWVGRCLSSILCIGYLMQPFTARRQALHDLMAGTLVWQKPSHSSATKSNLAVKFIVAVVLGVAVGIMELVIGAAVMVGLVEIGTSQSAEHQQFTRQNTAYLQLQSAQIAYDAQLQRTGQAPQDILDLQLLPLTDPQLNFELRHHPERVVATLEPHPGHKQFISQIKTDSGWRCVTNIEPKLSKLQTCQRHDDDTGGLSAAAPTGENSNNAEGATVNAGDGNVSATIHSQTGDNTSVDVHSNDGTGDVHVHVGKDGVTVETPDANKP